MSERNPTYHAREACKRFLQDCIALGWKAGQMVALEKLWWKYHDDEGDLVVPEEEPHHG